MCKGDRLKIITTDYVINTENGDNDLLLLLRWSSLECEYVVVVKKSSLAGKPFFNMLDKCVESTQLFVCK